MLARRDLFRLGARKAARAARRSAIEDARKRAGDWLRPPFAGSEPDFLASCTRCDKCIDACPHRVLFALPERFGPPIAGTPAMDLLNHGCHMCRDWPCVSVCEPGALALPEQADGTPPTPPKLAVVRIDTRACLPYLGPECGACAHACPVSGALEWVDGIKPVVNQDICTGCALCREACIVEPKAIQVSAFMPDEETAAAP